MSASLAGAVVLALGAVAAALALLTVDSLTIRQRRLLFAAVVLGAATPMLTHALATYDWIANMEQPDGTRPGSYPALDQLVARTWVLVAVSLLVGVIAAWTVPFAAVPLPLVAYAVYVRVLLRPVFAEAPRLVGIEPRTLTPVLTVSIVSAGVLVMCALRLRRPAAGGFVGRRGPRARSG